MEKKKTFKKLFAGTGIEPTTDENGGVDYNFKATLKKEPQVKTSNMKLYTEEQLHNTVIAVSNYLDDINLGRAQEKIEKHLKALQPIELPSDEEIENIMISKYPHSVGVGIDHLIKSDERIGFEEGAKWMKEQILNQNK